LDRWGNRILIQKDLEKRQDALSFRKQGRIVMDNQPGASIERYFADLEDPRVERAREHKLLGIVVITVCAVICGADGWVGIQEFGEAKLNW